MRGPTHRRLKGGDLRRVELFHLEPAVPRRLHHRRALRLGVRPRPEVERAVHLEPGAELLAPLAVQLRAADGELAQQLRALLRPLLAERRGREARNPRKLARLRPQLQRCLRIQQEAQAVPQGRGRRRAIRMARRDHAGRTRGGPAADAGALQHHRRDPALREGVGDAQTHGATADDDDLGGAGKRGHGGHVTGVLFVWPEPANGD